MEILSLNIDEMKLIRPELSNELTETPVHQECGLFFKNRLFSQLKLCKHYDFRNTYQIHGPYTSAESLLTVIQGGILFVFIDARNCKSHRRQCEILLSDRNQWGVYLPKNITYYFMPAIEHETARLLILASTESSFSKEQFLSGASQQDIYWPISELKRLNKLQLI